MAKKKNEEIKNEEIIEENNSQFIVEEEKFTSEIFSHSAKLINPKIYRKILVENYKEEIMITPLETGLGNSIGNALRRTMLSQLSGYAIGAAKIMGCTHKFQNISGVRENVCDILMNLKEVVIKGDKINNTPGFYGTINVEGPCDVTAKDIKMEQGEISNPDHFICSVDVNGSFSAKLLICWGRGYVVAQHQKFQNTTSEEDKFLESALIMDATYNQINRVEYAVEPTRVDEKTDYDKLIFTIETNGSITPNEALGTAYGVLTHQMDCLKELAFAEIQIEEKEKSIENINIPDIMTVQISKIGLPYRVQNTLLLNNITRVGDLVTKPESLLMRLPRMGYESLTAIKQTLSASGLTLGMTIPGWVSDPVDLESLEKNNNKLLEDEENQEKNEENSTEDLIL
jgi:DNA-directed RNA polymerase subunit alpha